MALSSGFFKAELVNDQPDRVYGFEQFGSLFDGVITDGIFENYGDAFKVTMGDPTSSGLRVYVGTGRAWFNKTWTLNSSSYTLDIAKPSATAYRMDSVVLDINANNATRENKILVLKGTESLSANVSPQNLVRSDSDKHWQYLLATVLVKPSLTITNDAMVVTNVINRHKEAQYSQAAPYATAVVPTTETIDNIINSLEEEFRSYQSRYQAEFNTWMNNIVGHLGTLSNEQTVRLALMVGEIYRSDYISGEYPFVDEDGTLWLSLDDNETKPSVDINFGYASLPYAANGLATEVVVQSSEYTIIEEE